MRAVKVTGLSILAPTTRCAHNCRYCSIGTTQFSDLPLSRISPVVERFAAWRKQRGLNGFTLWVFAGNAFDYEPKKMKEIRRLWKITGQPADGMATGGLRMRGESELREWLMRLKELGIGRLHAAFAGYGATHDRWNRRRGDFDYLLKIQQVGAALGMSSSQSLFMTKSTLPLMESLLEKLDAITANVRWRWAFPFSYLGRAARHEADRIDEQDRDGLMPRIANLCGDMSDWRSEREWIEQLSCDSEIEHKVTLTLRLDSDSIQNVEAMTCDEIVSDLTSRTVATYASLPTTAELCARVADPTNLKIYCDRGDVERLWMNRFLKEVPTTFERQLTDLAINP